MWIYFYIYLHTLLIVYFRPFFEAIIQGVSSIHKVPTFFKRRGINEKQQLACNQRVHERVHPGPTNQKHLPDPQTNVFSYIRGGEKLNNGIAQ